MTVSIPHRYDSNGTEVDHIQPLTERFQFLIGTIRTIAGHFQAVNGSRVFQFLIGTIRTKAELEARMKETEFQFLIGTIRTPAYPPRWSASASVSIPHRYDSNCIGFS